MPTTTTGLAAMAEKAPLAPFTFDRRDLKTEDVQINISYAGICHSDIHTVTGDWGDAMYPCVPGHEIVGTVAAVGSEVTKFKVGDVVGVGVFVDACRECEACVSGEDNMCNDKIWTYNAVDKDMQVTHGGYSKVIVVAEKYVLRVAPSLDRKGVAPLLCAGITVYSPIKEFGIKAGSRLGVVGLGGLGHMAVKFGVALGAHVTVFSRSESKREETLNSLKAHAFVNTSTKGEVAKLAGKLNLIIDTVSAEHNYAELLECLATRGVLCLVGLPPTNVTFPPNLVVDRRRHVTGSNIGSIKETQEMLDFCAEKNITSDVEVIQGSYVNQAYERVVKSDVRYRFVIDVATI